jgi:hypothetical protein
LEGSLVVLTGVSEDALALLPVPPVPPSRKKKLPSAPAVPVVGDWSSMTVAAKAGTLAIVARARTKPTAVMVECTRIKSLQCDDHENGREMFLEDGNAKAGPMSLSQRFQWDEKHLPGCV